VRTKGRGKPLKGNPIAIKGALFSTRGSLFWRSGKKTLGTVKLGQLRKARTLLSGREVPLKKGEERYIESGKPGLTNSWVGKGIRNLVTLIESSQQMLKVKV